MSVFPAHRSRTQGRISRTIWIVPILLITAIIVMFASQIPVQAVNPPVAYDQAVATDEDTAKNITLSASDQDGDPLSYVIVTPPFHGSLGGTLPNVTYVPHANYAGSDRFTFKANDGDQDSNIATVSITVSAVNDTPTANGQAIATNEDTPKAVALTASDVDGDSLTFVIVTQPTKGVLSGSPPNVTYTPNANYNGSDSFTFKANDGAQDSNVATVSITVNPVEDVPVAKGQAVITPQATPKTITLVATDGDGDSLTYAIVTGPTHGVLSGTAPNITYVPDKNYNGPDSFTFKANDGDQDSNTAAVSITVNNPPVANAQAVSTNEDTSKAITLTASDTEGDPLTYSIVAGPANGTLSGTAPNVTYTPKAHYYGSDIFTFKANDGDQDSNVATVSITVFPIEDVPVANNQAVVTDEDVPLAIKLTATDGDGDPLTYSIVAGPTNGTLSGTVPNVTYTPKAEFSGSDSFTFKANDGDQDSNVATVSITINVVNDPPVAHNQSITTAEDTPRSVTLTGSDIDSTALTFAVVSGPAHGVLSGTPPNLTYTPSRDFYGSDSFTFKANDGNRDSAPATVSITVTPVEDAPVARDQNIDVNEDTPRAFVLDASDGDGDKLTYTLDTLPKNGSLGGVLPNVTYTPKLNYNGPDSFTFHVHDGKQASNIATVSITVHPVNDPPVANGQALQINEDKPQAIVLAATDVDGDPLTFEVTTPPTHGTLSGTPPQLTYTPHPDYNGSDAFGFRAKDAQASSETAWVTIEIAPVNDPPIANSNTVAASEDVPRSITLTGRDVDGDPLTFSITVQPTEGTLTGTPPNVTYTPRADYYGADSFTFQVRDPAGLTGSTQVKINVSNVNDDPRATNDKATIKEDSTEVPINVIFNDTYLPDPFETLTIKQTGPAAHGLVTIHGGGSRVAYTPETNYYGPDSFTYTIVDGNGGSATATVSVNVTNENDPPLARPDNAEMDEDGGAIEIPVVDNDTYLPDPEEDLDIVGISDAPHGRVIITDGTHKSLTYTPNPDYFGTDTFTYSITDHNSGYSTTIVRVQVRAVNDPPIADHDNARTTEDTPVTVNVLANDVDIDSALDRASVQVTSAPGYGTTSVNRTTGEITYDPTPDWHGIDSLTYRVCDDAVPALCDEAQVDIAVGSVNDPPVSNAGPDQTVDTNARVTLDGSGSYDPDGSPPLTYQWSQISGPPVILTDPGSESPSFIAPDDPWVLVFELIVIDSEGKTDRTPDQVTITVRNQPPVSDAGPDKIEQIESLVTLDGSASTDPDGDLPLQYLWTQSGGPTVTLNDPTWASPTFTAPSSASVLTFTLFVTDTYGEPDATPDQVVVTISEPFYVYLPTVSGKHVIAPDLIVESITATTRNVTLVIKNQGDAPVRNEFWVDVYINPGRPPAAVNETFDDVGSYGLAWAVRRDAWDHLVPGGTLVLRMNDAYYDPDISVFPGTLQPGTPIYAQVDSFNPGTSYGTVFEKHEAIGEAYNNISGPVISQEATALADELPPETHRQPLPPDFPRRR